MNATLRTEAESPGLAAANKSVLADQATAYSSLGQVRNELHNAVTAADAAMDKLRELIVQIRPTGVLTVEQMAEAIGRDRNYIDSTWSAFGGTTTGKQTRVSAAAVSEAESRAAAEALADANKAQLKAADRVKSARAERDRVVAMVYASRILGPSAIADAAYIDRNHVLRIARKAGVAPVHRPASRNQYSPAPRAKAKRRSKRPAAE